MGRDGVHLCRSGIALGAHLKACSTCVLVGALRLSAPFALDCMAAMAAIEGSAPNDAAG